MDAAWMSEDLAWRCGVREDGEEKFLGMNFDVSAALTDPELVQEIADLPLYMG